MRVRPLLSPTRNDFPYSRSSYSGGGCGSVPLPAAPRPHRDESDGSFSSPSRVRSPCAHQHHHPRACKDSRLWRKRQTTPTPSSLSPLLFLTSHDAALASSGTDDMTAARTERTAATASFRRVAATGALVGGAVVSRRDTPSCSGWATRDAKPKADGAVIGRPPAWRGDKADGCDVVAKLNAKPANPAAAARLRAHANIGSHHASPCALPPLLQQTHSGGLLEPRTHLARAVNLCLRASPYL